MKRFVYMLAAVIAAAGLAAGCGKKQAQEPETTVTQTATAESTEAETKEPSTAESETETEAQTQEEEAAAGVHMLQGTITKTAQDGAVFTLQADDGKSYEIKLSDIRDAEVEIKKDVQIAIAYLGEPLGELGDVTMVVALPEQEEWDILTVEGTTVSNAMSTFTVETEDGESLSFLKDNCPMEEGALAGDSGDKVQVIYVSSEGMNYPVEIRKAR